MDAYGSDISVSLNNVKEIKSNVYNTVYCVYNKHTNTWDGTVVNSSSSNALPIASSSTLGGIKVGNNLSISSDGTLSADIPYIMSVERGGTGYSSIFLLTTLNFMYLFL